MLYVNDDLKYETVITSYITQEEINEVMNNLKNIRSKTSDNKEQELADFIIYLYENDTLPIEFFERLTTEEVDIFLNRVEQELLMTLDKDSETELRKRVVNSKIAENIESIKSKRIRNLPSSAYFF